MKTKIELCAASVEAVRAGHLLNIDRLELCQCLEYGGLTPSAAMVRFAVSTGIATRVLIRPRIGNFCYNRSEIKQMVDEILWCSKQGVEGVVIGILDNQNNIAVSAVKACVQAAGTMNVCFHRAFDYTTNYQQRIDTLVELKVTGILSAGSQYGMTTGIETLRQMKQYAKNRIEIVAGGGIGIALCETLLSRAKPNAIHFSATTNVPSDSNSPFDTNRLQFDLDKAKMIIEEVSTLLNGKKGII